MEINELGKKLLNRITPIDITKRKHKKKYLDPALNMYMKAVEENPNLIGFRVTIEIISKPKSHQQVKFLYGHVFKLISEHMGERDVDYIEKYCLQKFAAGFTSVSAMNMYELSTFITAITNHFTMEEGIVFGDDGEPLKY